MRRFLVTLVAVATLSGPMLAVTGATPTAAQPQTGLVNIDIDNVLNRNNVSLVAALQLVAQVCNNANNLEVEILDLLDDEGNQTFTGACTTGATTQNITVEEIQGPGGSEGKPKGKQ